jgi:hypothetical protein
MAFFFGCLSSIWIGRKIGWAISRSVLYSSGWAVCLVLCVAWASGVACVLRLSILTTQPGLLLRLFGYGAGAYISIPNYGLVDEKTIPERRMSRHIFIRSVPFIVYIVTSIMAVFSPISILQKVLLFFGIMFVIGMFASAVKRNRTHVLEDENA